MTAAMPAEERAAPSDRDRGGQGRGRQGAGHSDRRPEGRSDLPGGLRKQRNRPAKAAGGGSGRGAAQGSRPNSERASTTPINQDAFKGPKRGGEPAKRWSPVD